MAMQQRLNELQLKFTLKKANFVELLGSKCLFKQHRKMIKVTIVDQRPFPVMRI